MKLDESKYPMTYNEYEKRVVELLLEDYAGDDLQLMIDKVDRELAKEPNYIEGFYGQDCFRYDHPEIFGKDSKKRFTDRKLRQNPVANLRQIIG